VDDLAGDRQERCLRLARHKSVAVLTGRYLADRQHDVAKIAKQAADCNCVLRSDSKASSREAYAELGSANA
jgi:hypothetical protein